MRVLMAHNRYTTRGGEDAVFDQEAALLRSHGHEVIEYLQDNRDMSSGGRLKLAAEAVWSRRCAREVGELIEANRPDVVHVHNTVPQISPAIYYAASRHDVPVVQTLHNYRLLCASALLLRDSAVCEKCVGRRLAWPAVQHACYRGDRAATSVMVASTAIHRGMGTWRNQVSRYIALCEFSRGKLLEAGLPASKVVVKPNFATDRHGPDAPEGIRSGGLFVGRLSVEKGIDVLLDAWRGSNTSLRMIGPGELTAAQADTLGPQVQPLGFVDDPQLTSEMQRAAFIVIPSLVYEGFPMVLAEAYAAGLPIIASRLGALSELVEDGVTGLHFIPGDSDDLASKVRWAKEHPVQMREMGERARSRYEAWYAPEPNYERLMDIYADAIGARTT